MEGKNNFNLSLLWKICRCYAKFEVARLCEKIVENSLLNLVPMHVSVSPLLCEIYRCYGRFVVAMQNLSLEKFVDNSLSRCT